jgi:hypothetical protein
MFHCSKWIQLREAVRRWPEPLGWMLRGGEANLKKGRKIVEIFRSLNTEVFDRAYTKVKIDELNGQFWVEDVERDEFKKAWEEGDV